MVAGSNPLHSNWKHVLTLPGKRFYNMAIIELCNMCWTSLHLGVSAGGTPSGSSFIFSNIARMSIQHGRCVSAVGMGQQEMWGTGDCSSCTRIRHRLQSTLYSISIVQHTALFKTLSRGAILKRISTCMLQILGMSGKISDTMFYNFVSDVHLQSELTDRHIASFGGTC
jgi:hypothetical protein